MIGGKMTKVNVCRNVDNDNISNNIVNCIKNN